MCPAERYSGSSPRDASEQAGTGSDLLEPERITSSIVDALATPLAVLDETGTILRTNDAWRALDKTASPFGGATAEGANCFWACDVAEGAGADDAKAIAAGIRAVASSERSDFTLGYSPRSADDNRCFVVRATRLHAPGLIRVLLTLEDVTARKQAEARSERLSAELRRSDEELERLAHVASHDLQEPLRIVASYTELLGRRYKGRLDAKADEFMEFARAGADRAQQLTKKLFSELATYFRVRTCVKEFEIVDCTTAFRQAAAELDAEIKASGAAVSCAPLPGVMADPVQLGQLFRILISNALQYHGENPPQLRVSAERQGPDWVFSVRDNGIGIDPRHAERIFGLFQRLHSWDERPGTGIGLAICKRIVELHGGRIWVESQPGSGATFSFTIPAELRNA